jgi:SAM-dependent methyltransferase
MKFKTKEWFREWFDSPYYHILYKNHDDTEAQLFIDRLAMLLHFQPDDKMLDIACGRGRHSIYLNSLGYDVSGIDIAPRNIAYAQQFENERLHFYIHDMRKLFRKDSFDYALNLFTSFGYFESDAENVQSICAAAQSLKEEGKLVLDFFNSPKIIRELISYELKQVEGIDFNIHKQIEGDFVVKDINFEDMGKQYHFQERVKAITPTDFMRYFQKAGLEVLYLFGDYQLNEYKEEESPRMIFVTQKKCI